MKNKYFSSLLIFDFHERCSVKIDTRNGPGWSTTPNIWSCLSIFGCIHSKALFELTRIIPTVLMLISWKSLHSSCTFPCTRKSEPQCLTKNSKAFRIIEVFLFVTSNIKELKVRQTDPNVGSASYDYRKYENFRKETRNGRSEYLLNKWLHSISFNQLPTRYKYYHYCSRKFSRMLIFLSYFSIHTICFDIEVSKILLSWVKGTNLCRQVRC